MKELIKKYMWNYKTKQKQIKKIIRTKIRLRIKQNVKIIHTLKSMGKHTKVRIKQNVRISQGSHYPGSTVTNNQDCSWS